MSALIGLAERLGLRVCSGPWRQAAAAAGLRPWPNHQEQPHQCQQQRRFSTIDEHKDEIESINELFVEARDEIDYAKEDAETVYFNESCAEARQAVQAVLDRYEAVLQRLSNEERGKLQRSMGLKMEQLKAEVAQLDTLHD